MKTFASALLLVCSASALDEYENSLTYPGDKCCRFYRNEDYEHHFGEGEFCVKDDSEETSYSIDIFDANPISSYICGKNVAVDVCMYTSIWDYKCQIKGAGFIMNQNTITSNETYKNINMKLYNPAIRGAVTMFQGHDCHGQSDRYFWKADTPFEGAYNYKGVIPEWYASSVHVPYGYSLRLYSDYLWQDLIKEIVGDYDDQKTQKPTCQPIFDEAYSITNWQSWEVVKNHGQNSPDPALGYWKGITSTESQEFEYHVGISNTESAGSSSERAKSMENALNAGIAVSAEVGGSYGPISAGVSTTISADFGKTWGSSSRVVEDARTAMKEDYSIKYKTTCKTEGKNGAGLYQYVYKTTDGSANLFTSHTVCRVGEHWNTPPACLWHACKNPDCTCCEGDPDC